jgi:hypothetical protein
VISTVKQSKVCRRNGPFVTVAELCDLSRRRDYRNCCSKSSSAPRTPSGRGMPSCVTFPELIVERVKEQVEALRHGRMGQYGVADLLVLKPAEHCHLQRGNDLACVVA